MHALMFSCSNYRPRDFTTWVEVGARVPKTHTYVTDSCIDFFEISGTHASCAGYPTTRTKNGFSLGGRFKIWLRKPIGLGVWVSATKPAIWTAETSIPVAIPTDSDT